MNSFVKIFPRQKVGLRSRYFPLKNVHSDSIAVSLCGIILLEYFAFCQRPVMVCRKGDIATIGGCYVIASNAQFSSPYNYRFICGPCRTGRIPQRRELKRCGAVFCINDQYGKMPVRFFHYWQVR